MNDFLADIMLLCAWIAVLLTIFCVALVIADRFIDKKPWRDL